MANDMQSELRDLQQQVSTLRDALAREGNRAANTMRDRTAVAMDTASRRAREAADYTRAEAGSMAGIFRDHPAASSGALITAGIIGGLIGYFLSSSTPSRDYSHRNWF